ncbi:MAG: hypothetical protein OEQ53_09920, partial [Saprospiraceae bacterium]|nr:hypothetical protein [Saprospiraceae bacterium]
MKLILLGIALLQIACQPSNNFDTNEQVLPVSSQDSPWAEYWYAGTAELNVFEVEQARYNEVHPGQTVLVFVTEDFLTDKQVKNESAPKKQSTSVLKTNLIRNFTTG